MEKALLAVLLWLADGQACFTASDSRRRPAEYRSARSWGFPLMLRPFDVLVSRR